jgi:hypothetical protein
MTGATKSTLMKDNMSYTLIVGTVYGILRDVMAFTRKDVAYPFTNSAACPGNYRCSALVIYQHFLGIDNEITYIGVISGGQ